MGVAQKNWNRGVPTPVRRNKFGFKPFGVPKGLERMVPNIRGVQRSLERVVPNICDKSSRLEQRVPNIVGAQRSFGTDRSKLLSWQQKSERFVPNISGYQRNLEQAVPNIVGEGRSRANFSRRAARSTGGAQKAWNVMFQTSLVITNVWSDPLRIFHAEESWNEPFQPFLRAPQGLERVVPIIVSAQRVWNAPFQTYSLAK